MRDERNTAYRQCQASSSKLSSKSTLKVDSLLKKKKENSESDSKSKSLETDSSLKNGSKKSSESDSKSKSLESDSSLKSGSCTESNNSSSSSIDASLKEPNSKSNESDTSLKRSHDARKSILQNLLALKYSGPERCTDGSDEEEDDLSNLSDITVSDVD